MLSSSLFCQLPQLQPGLTPSLLWSGRGQNGRPDPSLHITAFFLPVLLVGLYSRSGKRICLDRCCIPGHQMPMPTLAGRGALGAVGKVSPLHLGVDALILSSTPLEGMEFRFMPIDQGIDLYAGGTCCERLLSGIGRWLYMLSWSDSTMPLASSLTTLCLQIFSFISILCLHS